MATVDWVTTAEVKAQLEIQGSGRDTAIAACITAASRVLNRRCARELTPKTASATRMFRVFPRQHRSGVLVDLAPFDLRTAATVRLHPEGTPVTLVQNTDYALWPVGGAQPTATYLGIKLSSVLSLESSFSESFGYAQLEVQGAWGAWDTAEVPEDVKRACIVTVGSWIDKAMSEYGAEFAEEPRAIQSAIFAGYAVPRGALSILQGSGLMRSTTV